MVVAYKKIKSSQILEIEPGFPYLTPDRVRGTFYITWNFDQFLDMDVYLAKIHILCLITSLQGTTGAFGPFEARF